MAKFNKQLLFSIVIFISSNTFAGGGWTQKKGETYAKLSEWWLVADQHYTDQGKIDPNATVGIFNTSIYVEHGFTDKLTGIVYFPFFSRALINNQVSKTNGSTAMEGDAINSIGDTDIALKYSLGKWKNLNFASKLQLGLPIGESSGGIAKNLQTGDGEFNQLLQIDAGTSVKIHKEGKVSGYSNIYVGFNNRTKGFSDELRYGAEFGFGFKNNTIWTIAKLNSIASLKNGTLSAVNSTSIFANNTEYISIAFEGACYLTKKWGVSFEYATAVAGKIILAKPSYSAGVFCNFGKNNN